MISDYVDEILEYLEEHKIPKETVIAIYQTGSSLYFKDCGDVDIRVIATKRVPLPNQAYIDGKYCDIIVRTPEDWNHASEEKYESYFLAQCPDEILLYGSESKVKKYDPLTDKQVQSSILKFYEKKLFNDSLTKPKKLWNFLLLAFKLQNNSNKLTEYQLKEMNKARKGLISAEKYRPLFDELKKQIFGGN